MLKTYFLDVKAAERTLNRFEALFAADAEAIQHSTDLAAMLRLRHFPIQLGLMIAVLDQSGRKIHEEVVYPDGEQGT